MAAEAFPIPTPHPADPIESLATSPERDLWVGVLQGALDELVQVAERMSKTVRLDRMWPPLSPPAGPTPSELCEMIESARSVLGFFANRDSSTLDAICEILDLDADALRAIASAEIERTHLRERVLYAEIWLGRAGLAA